MSAVLDRLRVATRGSGRDLPPMLRTYRDSLWTMRTNGHVLIAIRGAHTKRTSGPTDIMRQLGTRRRSRRFAMADLRYFAGGRTGSVKVSGVVVDPDLLRRALRGLRGDSVTLAASTVKCDRKPHCLFMDTDDAVVVVMALLKSPRAEFPKRGAR